MSAWRDAEVERRFLALVAMLRPPVRPAEVRAYEVAVRRAHERAKCEVDAVEARG